MEYLLGIAYSNLVDSADVNTIYLDRKATFAAGNLQKISYKTSSLDEKKQIFLFSKSIKCKRIYMAGKI